MMKTIFVIALLILFATAFSSSNAQIAVIANKSVPVRSITKSALTDIFTLNKLNWDDGSKIVVVDLRGESSLKENFYDFMGFTYSQIQKLWLKKQFSGKSMPPQAFKSEKEIVEKVANTPGAIGYVSMKSVTKDVVVLAKIQN